MCVHIYIYIYYVCVYMYIYIYICVGPRTISRFWSMLNFPEGEMKVNTVPPWSWRGQHWRGGGKQRYPLLFGVFGLRALGCSGF